MLRRVDRTERCNWTELNCFLFRLGVVHKWRHPPRGRGVHDIVTMCDVGGRGGWRLCDVTHVTSAARPFHVILHVSWWDNFYNSDHFYTSELWYTMLMLLMCQDIQKFTLCLKYIDHRYRLHYRQQGGEVCDVILGCPQQWNETWLRREGVLFLYIAWRHLLTIPYRRARWSVRQKLNSVRSVQFSYVALYDP